MPEVASTSAVSAPPYTSGLPGSGRGSRMMETERIGEGQWVERRSRQGMTLDP